MILIFCLFILCCLLIILTFLFTTKPKPKRWIQAKWVCTSMRSPLVAGFPAQSSSTIRVPTDTDLPPSGLFRVPSRTFTAPI